MVVEEEEMVLLVASAAGRLGHQLPPLPLPLVSSAGPPPPSSSSSTATLQLRQPLAARQPRRQVEAETMREIVHIQAGQCGNQIGAKVRLQNRPPNVSKLFSSPQFCVFQVASCVRQRVRPLDLPVWHGTPSKGGALGAARGRF